MGEDHRMWTSDQLPDHESGVRRLVSDSQGRQYKAFQSLSEAKAAPGGVVVLEGDYGGQIYVVAAAEVVECSEEDLQLLLADVDQFAWKDMEGARVFYEAADQGSSIAGGMGGGRVTKGIWVHEVLKKLDLEDGIKAVVSGKRKRLSG